MRHYKRVLAEVDLDAILQNLEEIRDHLKPGVKICSVIKADGYGHGSVPIAKTLSDAGVEAFAVASCQEAVLLRKNGVKGTIMVLGYTSEEEYPELIKYQITQTIFRLDMAKSLSDAALSLGKVASIHIKLDTGMGRIGFMPSEESIHAIKEIASYPLLSIDGIFSHFARADEVDKDPSEVQYRQFETFMDRLVEEGIKVRDQHMANSAGFLDLPYAHLDMVRVGIAMYGLYPSGDVNHESVLLRPALTLKSSVIMIKEVPKGYEISYGGTYVTKAPTKIATIPVGYGDGYPRALSNKGRVLIHGKPCPILGRVCMDQFMVDVSHLNEVKEGDEVVLIGRQGEEIISAEEIAMYQGTINYEVVCQLGKRIPRVYLKEGKPVFSIDYF